MLSTPRCAAYNGGVVFGNDYLNFGPCLPTKIWNDISAWGFALYFPNGVQGQNPCKDSVLSEVEALLRLSMQA